MTYEPQVDDYVKWEHGGHIDEGWVYFKCEQYITIETRVKDKCEQNIKDCPIHKKTHVLLLCYPMFWHQLEYVKTRASNCSEYKSQEYRDSDLYG